MATDKLMNSSQGDDIISALEGIATAIPSINTTTEIPSSQVTAMTGYAKSTSATPGAITTDDTLNEAVGKLEKKVDNNASAIGSLDNASVGLGNVTNNTQVKALSGTVTNGGIVTFGADGSTVADSAKTIETSLSDNNNKIPTSKAVRDNVADVAKLSTYSAGAGTTFKTVSATDTITDAIENVQNNALYNKTNILLNTEYGVANIMPVPTSLNKSDSGLLYNIVGDKYILSGSKTIAASYYMVLDNIVLKPNTDYTIYIDHQNNTTTTQLQIVAWNGNTWVDISGGATTGTSTINSSNYEKFMARLLPNVNVGSAVDDTVRIMITPKSLGISSYQLYAMTNAELTPYATTPRTKLVYSNVYQASSTHQYTMNMSDFAYSQFAGSMACGTYLISVVTWSTTPKHGLWIVSYSGGARSYAVLSNIVNQDAATVSVVTNVSEPYIEVTASGKVTISTLN